MLTTFVNTDAYAAMPDGSIDTVVMERTHRGAAALVDSGWHDLGSWKELNAYLSRCQIVERPWGYFEILDRGAGYCVKRLVVYPGKRLSLQRHAHRLEHWSVVEGEPTIEIDGIEHKRARVGAAYSIPVGALHRLSNDGVGRSVIIETQIGDCREDDIERFDDDFGRVT